MPGLRIVPLFLVRGPHEIAMSIFRRSQGDRDYAQALDVTAVHFRRMKEICDQWPGPRRVVQFDPQICGVQLQRAAELCGLNWSDAAFAEVYDASCRHHEAAVIDHPAQAAFEALAGLPASPPSAESYRRLLADAATREATLRQRRDLRREQRDAARQERDTARTELDVARRESPGCGRKMPLAEDRGAGSAAGGPAARKDLRSRLDPELQDLAGPRGPGQRPGTRAAGQRRSDDSWHNHGLTGRMPSRPQQAMHYCERKDHAGN